MWRKITNHSDTNYYSNLKCSSVDENELWESYDQWCFWHLRDSFFERSLIGRKRNEFWWKGNAMSEWRKKVKECGGLDWRVGRCELKDECGRYGEGWRWGWVEGGGGGCDGVLPPWTAELSSAFFCSLFDHKLAEVFRIPFIWKE